VVGFPDQQFAKLHQQFAVDQILQELSASPGINFIEIKNPHRDYRHDMAGISVKDVSVAGYDVVVGFDTARYEQRVSKVWQDFFLYGTLLGGFGLFLSYLLYKYQQHYFEKIQNFERALAREQEDAVLGRAAGTIAHEVRNPLNAIGIGLQRISLEASLEHEHEELVAAMGEALRRTNMIVEGLLNYSQPLSLAKQPCSVDHILAQVVLLRESQCQSEAIDLAFSPNCNCEARLDRDLFSQLIDNLLKNSIEAQPAGGWIVIESGLFDGQVRIRVKNPGFEKGAEIDQLAEPYFTGKTRGSGLGLAICERIVQAHGGQLLFTEPETGVLQVDVVLPVS
jgi:signal transduction histidine kinase